MYLRNYFEIKFNPHDILYRYYACKLNNLVLTRSNSLGSVSLIDFNVVFPFKTNSPDNTCPTLGISFETNFDCSHNFVVTHFAKMHATRAISNFVPLNVISLKAETYKYLSYV